LLLIALSLNFSNRRKSVVSAGDYVASIAENLQPLTLESHLKAPFDAMTRYQQMLSALLELTPKVNRFDLNLEYE
jgi:hypothetical protein